MYVYAVVKCVPDCMYGERIDVALFTSEEVAKKVADMLREEGGWYTVEWRRVFSTSEEYMEYMQRLRERFRRWR